MVEERVDATQTCRTLKLTIEYDGTDFHGWQVQPELRTVQQTVQDALDRILGPRSGRIYGASRTDAGVHALGQVASFATDHPIPCRGLLHAFRSHLPGDVAVVDVAEVPERFHARFSALGKRYRYRVLDSPVPRPLERRTSYRSKQRLELEPMAEAGAVLVGTHDFRGFARADEERPTVRTLLAVDVSRKGPIVCIDVEGDGFLHNMVRVLAGTLVEVGRGASSPERVAQALATRDRRLAGPTLPGQGLFLVEVLY